MVVVMVVVMVDSIEVVGTQLSGGGRRESFEEIRANKSNRDPQRFLRSLLRSFVVRLLFFVVSFTSIMFKRRMSES